MIIRNPEVVFLLPHVSSWTFILRVIIQHGSSIMEPQLSCLQRKSREKVEKKSPPLR